MKDIEKLKTLVESRGGKPLELDTTSVRLRLGFDLDDMKRNGFDSSIIEDHRGFNDRIEKFIAHPTFGEYLRHLSPEEKDIASGLVVYPLEYIKGCVGEGCPGGFIFPFGYLPIANSIGGNEIFIHVDSGNVLWADHESFSTAWISYKNRETEEWESCDFSEENVPKAMVLISNDFEHFLADFLNDKLKTRFDDLD